MGTADELPPEYWQTLLDDAVADTNPIRARLCDIVNRHLLSVACRRRGRIVEIRKTDALRLCGPQSVWKEVGRWLLDDTCTQRTGRHEEDAAGSRSVVAKAKPYTTENYRHTIGWMQGCSTLHRSHAAIR